MKLRFAFIGFRHGHIYDLYRGVADRSDCEIVAAVEDDTEAACDAGSRGVAVTGTSVDELFAEPGAFDVVAVGDYYDRRGVLTIRALESGKHVISDKPLCTRLEEIERIRELAETRALKVGCMLDLRNTGYMRTIRRLLADGAIGDLQTIGYMGQHPLLYGSRARWYFEEGKHGGTINDIAIHAIDCLPYVTGSRFVEVVCARVWNTRLPQHPFVNVGAQLMMRMADETGVLGDVSYLSPDSQGYTVPQYWRFTFHGTEGIIEGSRTVPEVRLWRNGRKEGETLVPDTSPDGGYLLDFIDEIQGVSTSCVSTTDQILESTRVTLHAQRAADQGLTYLPI